MDAILMVVLIFLPVVAAIRGVGSRPMWFGLSLVALTLMFGSCVLSMREKQAVIDKQIERIISEPTRDKRQGKSKTSPLLQEDSSVERIQEISEQLTSKEADRNTERIGSFLTSAFLGFLLAGVFYRTKAGRQDEAGTSPRPPMPRLAATIPRAPVQLSVTMREVQGVAVLDLRGRLVLGEACDTLREHLGQVLAAHRKKILLNLGDASHVDSSAIGILVEALVLTAEEGGKLKLVNLPRLVYNTLVVHRLLQAFEVYDKEEEALASFK